jgi:D-alanyl-D-alanine dipeptidase
MNNLLLFFIGYLLYPQTELPKGFVNLKEAIQNVVIDLRYYSSDNFIGDTITGYNAEKCFMSKEAASALTKVQADLTNQGLGLKVFDAYRPQRAVDHFARWAADLDDNKMKSIYYPNVPKTRLFELGYIAAKSGHTRGSTVDLTIIYTSGEDEGREMDMGTPWDFFSERSWPASDGVTSQQKVNRMLLRDLMIKHGFKPYEGEWWHFTLKNEPFPDTYFDFEVE